MQNKSISTARCIFINMIIASSIIFLLNSCSRKFSFSQSSVVPAAEGSVKVKKDRNKNYSLKVNTIHLAEPERLQTSKSTYVVWMDTERNGIKNIGQLNSSGSLFSKARKASLNTVTSFKPERFFITAEENANIPYPNGQVVLRTRN